MTTNISEQLTPLKVRLASMGLYLSIMVIFLVFLLSLQLTLFYNALVWPSFPCTVTRIEPARYYGQYYINVVVAFPGIPGLSLPAGNYSASFEACSRQFDNPDDALRCGRSQYDLHPKRTCTFNSLWQHAPPSDVQDLPDAKRSSMLYAVAIGVGYPALVLLLGALVWKTLATRYTFSADGYREIPPPSPLVSS